MTNNEHEEFLTPGDFKRAHQEISLKELEEINGHPLSDEEETEIKEELIDNDNERIGTTPTGMPIYRDTENQDIYHPRKTEKDPLLELREKQFWKIENIKEKMKKNGDERHLFLISSGRLMESPKGFKFWRGYLVQDVLAVKGKKGLELKPLFPNYGIRIRHPENETITWNISHLNARHKGIPKLDLTITKIDSPKKLNDEILSLNKK